jgi:hypothetical protein
MNPTTMINTRSAVLLLGLAVLPGCPLLDVEAEVPEVCLSYPNLSVQTPELPSATQSFVFDDLSKVHDIVKQEANLEFVRAQIRVTSGLDNLDFIDAVNIVVSSGDPDTKLAPLTMYHCDGDCAPEGDTLTLPAGAAHNAIDYLKEDSIKIDLEFHGRIPAASWTMDIDVCMKGRAGFQVATP